MAKNILVPIDFSDVTQRVVAQASRLAKALGAKIWLVHVTSVRLGAAAFEVGQQCLMDTVDSQIAAEYEKLREHLEALLNEGVSVTATLLEGAPAERIVEQATSVEAELMVIGSHGHGALHHLLTGSTCEAMLKHSPCPVLIVPSRTPVPV